MPDVLSRYIQDFARPRTSPQWRKGSYYSQHATYGEFYWEMFDGPWYDFYHEKDEIKLAYFLHGMHNMSISYMLRTLFHHVGDDFTLLLFDRIKHDPYLWNELCDEIDGYIRDSSLHHLERFYV